MGPMIRNFAMVTGSRLLDGVVRFLTVPLLLSHFGRSDFGLIALAFSMQAFLTIADFGLSVNAVKRMTEFLHQQDYAAIHRLTRSATLFYGLIGLVNLLGMAVLGWFGQSWFDLNDEQSQQFLFMMLALGISSFFTWTFSIYRQVLHAASLVGWDETINLIASALTLIAVGATLHWHLSPASYFVLVMLPPFVPLVLRLRRVRNLIPGLTIGVSLDWLAFKPLVGTSLWLFALMFAELMANNYRPIILSQQSGLESVADFRVIQQIAGFALILLSGCMSVVYPAIARLEAANDKSRIALVLGTGSRLLLWVHMGLLVTLAYLSETLIRVYVGEEFVHLWIPLAVWLVTLTAYHNSIVTSVVMARGRLAALTVSACCNSLITLMAAYWLAPRYGVLSVVYCYALYVALQLAVIYLISIPASGEGSGLKLVRTVFQRPVLCGIGAIALVTVVNIAAGNPRWVGAIGFVCVFAALALTVGGARRDWAALRSTPG